MEADDLLEINFNMFKKMKTLAEAQEKLVSKERPVFKEKLAFRERLGLKVLASPAFREKPA